MAAIGHHYLRAWAAPAAGGSQEKTWFGSLQTSAAPKHMSSSASLQHHQHLLPPPLTTHSAPVTRSEHSTTIRPAPPLFPLPTGATPATTQTRSSVSSALDLNLHMGSDMRQKRDGVARHRPGSQGSLECLDRE
ncbi:hypothetical protein E2562_023085 [Oryza meyeriana var. granulata]|uniref:Uncharacterized protein n=1 Tax=Oryza meyeriana var. granulata TaxID=110450 RepID=A0A6G1EP00_9ORYZ|nr:hypothetical protein E2562_023085 [Oryza meyeriana var. granulata]